MTSARKIQRPKRRGRKPGDGVLKNIDPKSSLLEKAMMLAYGRTYGDRHSSWVRWFRHLPSMLQDSTRPEFVDKRTSDILARFQQQMVNALFDFKPDWFEKMADAIKTEIAGQDAYPLHAALLSIAGAPRIRRTDLIYPENSAGMPLDQTPRFTIGQVCEILKKQGKRPTGQEDAEWHRTVRRACDEIGFPLLPSKPGRVRKKS
jgi:hypothetical protein